jgi:hypothetical protein
LRQDIKESVNQVDEKVKDIKESVNQGIEKALQMLSGGLIAMGRRIYLHDHKTLKDEV